MEDVHDCLKTHERQLFPITKKRKLPHSENDNGNNSNKSDGDFPLMTRVFVPLCGKTVDMAYLAQQPTVQEVVGLDGIRAALEDFANDHPSLEIRSTFEEPRKKEEGDASTEEGHVDKDDQNQTVDVFERWVGKKITLVKGDYFHFDEVVARGRFGAVFDRASLYAIHPSLREAYVSVMGKIIAPKGRILLSTLERVGNDKEALKRGPPFTLSEADVRALYEAKDWVESVTCLEKKDLFEKDPSLKDRYDGLHHLLEYTFLIKAK